MHPILFEIGSFPIYSYGLLVALAFFAGSMWVTYRATRAGELVDFYFQAIVWMILGGFFGARLLYVLYYPDLYLSDPLRILTDRGGLVWYGGLVSALVVLWLFVKKKHLNLARMADVMAPPAALGLAIGRLGCFMTGCCYGKATTLPWAVQFPPGHETHPAYVHPAQLYESLLLLVLVAILVAIDKRRYPAGVLGCLFVVGYGIIRFFLEYLRGDVIFWVGNVLTASQVFSLLGVLVGVVLLVHLFRHSAQPAGKAAPASKPPLSRVK